MCEVTLWSNNFFCEFDSGGMKNVQGDTEDSAVFLKNKMLTSDFNVWRD